MPDIWVVSANGGTARIFSTESPTGVLVELEVLQNPMARAKEQELVSDRPGRTFDSFGVGRHSKSSEVDPKQQEEIRFAREVADRLEAGRVTHAFDRVAVVASPAFLGHLRSSMSAPLRAVVSMELDKDYTALRPEELRAHLPERL